MSQTGGSWSRPSAAIPERAPVSSGRRGSLSVSRETLIALAARYGLPPSVAAPLEALLVALAREPNPPTTLRTPGEALDGHVADSLSGLEVTELARATGIADVGAGAGFPGLALAAALPEARVDLIESSARKAAAIERLAGAAGLGNALVRAVRAEEWGRAGGAQAYDVVTARAVAPLAVLAEYAAPLLREGGVLVAWKGSRDGAEEAAGAAACARLGLEPARILRVTPFEGARERHLHVLAKVAPTPPAFPRRPGMARKRPLAP